MSISLEQAEPWPKSKALADACVICFAVVYTTPAEGVAATLCNDEQAADALAVRYQQQGLRAWIVQLEGDGLLVHAD